MYACTGPAFTRNGLGATYGLSSVSACTKKNPLAPDPISIPSPLIIREHVSMQTRSPIPTGLTVVTVAGTRSTTCSDLRAKSIVLAICDKSLVSRSTPSAPCSKVSSAVLALSLIHISEPHETDSYLVCRLLLEKKKK